MEIRLFKPSLGKEELDAVKDSFERSWVGLGPKVNEFEQKWAEFIGCKVAIALNSCTAALHLALRVFGFPEGKKVLVPSLTFSATASAILYNRLIPVFVDSDPVTLGISLEDLDRKYDKDCVAVIPVHYCGHPVPMEKLVSWARERNLKIIEDCAHTAGGEYLGKKLGTWGDIGCFSFEEKKCMTTGDGGMICSDDADLLKDVKAMRWVGIDKDNWKTAQQYVTANKDAMHWFYEINVLGYKYNMNDLAASIGLAQLKKLPEFNRIRSNIIRKYVDGIMGKWGDEEMGKRGDGEMGERGDGEMGKREDGEKGERGNEEMGKRGDGEKGKKDNGKMGRWGKGGMSKREVIPLLPYEPEKYVYQMFGIRAEKRDELMIHLKQNGIATGCHYTPLSIQPLFKEWGNNCPFIEKEYNKFITLPLHTDLTVKEISYILDNISRFKWD